MSGLGSGNNFTWGISGAIVADGLTIKRLNSAGSVVATYDFGSGSNNIDTWVAVGLDPKDVDEAGADRAFWAGDFATGRVFRFNVSSGAVVDGGITPLSTGVTNALSGMCLNAEPTVGQFTGVINVTPTTPSGTVVFATGTPAVEEHTFGIGYGTLTDPALNGPVSVAVNAREVESDGVCTSGLETDTTDVDCGFEEFFSAIPSSRKALRMLTADRCTTGPFRHKATSGEAVVTISSEKSFNTILTAAGNCILTRTRSRISKPDARCASYATRSTLLRISFNSTCWSRSSSTNLAGERRPTGSWRRSAAARASPR